MFRLLSVSIKREQVENEDSQMSLSLPCKRPVPYNYISFTEMAIQDIWQPSKAFLFAYSCPITNSNILFITKDWKLSWLLNSWRRWDSTASIATDYWSDDPGIESRWGARFSAPVQTGPGTHPASCIMGTGSFPAVKRPGRGVDHPPPYSSEVKERVGLYLYSSHGPSWPILGWNLPLP